jgi:hypothetical protein
MIGTRYGKKWPLPPPTQRYLRNFNGPDMSHLGEGE